MQSLHAGRFQQILVATDQAVRLCFQSGFNEMIVITITAINSGLRHIQPNRTGIEVMQQAFTIFKTDTAVKFGSVKPSAQRLKGELRKHQTVLRQCRLHQIGGCALRRERRADQ